jgi:hypothetical protein
MTADSGFNLYAPCGSSSEYMGLGDTFWVGTACFQHVVASGAITKGDLVTITNGGTAVSATTTTVTNTTGQSVGKQLGIAIYAFADGERGGVLVGPFEKNPVDDTPFYVRSATGNLQASLQYTTATAGVVDDTATTLIKNLLLTADTVGTGPALTACRAVDRLVAGT